MVRDLPQPRRRSVKSRGPATPLRKLRSRQSTSASERQRSLARHRSIHLKYSPRGRPRTPDTHSISFVHPWGSSPPFFRLSPSVCTEAAAIGVHHCRPGAKHPDFYSIYVQIEDLGNFLHREAFDFLQQQNPPIFLGQTRQKQLDQLACLSLLIWPGWVAAGGCVGIQALNLILRKICFVYKWPDLLFPKRIPAFVHRNLVKPGGEGRAHVEPADRYKC